MNLGNVGRGNGRKGQQIGLQILSHIWGKGSQKWEAADGHVVGGGDRC